MAGLVKDSLEPTEDDKVTQERYTPVGATPFPPRRWG